MMTEDDIKRVLDKLEAMDEKLTEMDMRVQVGFARLPNDFVTRKEYDATKKEVAVNRRWTVTTVIAVAIGVWANLPFPG